MMNIMLVSVGVILLYLIIVLVSFNPEDPGWLQTTWHGSIHNAGGILGAKISDCLFFIFGFSAYIVPLFILFFLWKVCIQKVHITIFTFLFKFIVFLIFLLVCCGLNHLIVNNFSYFSSGGIIGSILYDLIFYYKEDLNKINYFFLLLLIGMIDIMILFDNFFGMVLKAIKKQLCNRAYYLNALLFCNKRCMYPFIFSTKKHNLLKNTENDSLKIHIFSDVSVNVKLSINRFSFKVKENLIKIQRIFTMNKFIQGFNIIKNVLSSITLYKIRKNCSYYIKMYIKNIFLQRSNNFMKINKYDKKICNNLKMCCFKEKELNNNVLSIRDLNAVSCIVSDDHKNKNVIDIGIKQHAFVSKNVNVLAIHQNLYHNDRNFIFPDINLLIKSSSRNMTDFLELKKFARLLETKLLEYKIVVNVVNIVPGPVITRFELNLSPGIKSSRISGLSRDLARVLHAPSVRVVEVIPGTPYVGLEIPNKKRGIVHLGDIINSEQFKNFNTPLALALGEDIFGRPFILDLRSMPHLLVSGTTGSGKSVGINAIIVSILYKSTPEEVCFIMIDPKILELSVYSGIPHLLKQVITDVQEVDETLQWCIKEMEHRYKLMAMIGVRNLENYNCYIEKFHSKKRMRTDTVNQYCNDNKPECVFDSLHKLPYIVIIVDEFSDLMLTTTKKIEALMIRLTQKARAAGIHVILATQRPSVDVITGLIKANIPARIAFTVSSKIDSYTILGKSGAESLLGMGDMLYLGPNSSVLIRAHGAFIEDKEIRAVVNFWKTKR